MKDSMQFICMCLGKLGSISKFGKKTVPPKMPEFWAVLLAMLVLVCTNKKLVIVLPYV